MPFNSYNLADPFFPLSSFIQALADLSRLHVSISLRNAHCCSCCTSLLPCSCSCCSRAGLRPHLDVLGRIRPRPGAHPRVHSQHLRAPSSAADHARRSCSTAVAAAAAASLPPAAPIARRPWRPAADWRRIGILVGTVGYCRYWLSSVQDRHYNRQEPRGDGPGAGSTSGDETDDQRSIGKRKWKVSESIEESVSSFLVHSRHSDRWESRGNEEEGLPHSGYPNTINEPNCKMWVRKLQANRSHFPVALEIIANGAEVTLTFKRGSISGAWLTVS